MPEFQVADLDRILLVDLASSAAGLQRMTRPRPRSTLANICPAAVASARREQVVEFQIVGADDPLYPAVEGLRVALVAPEEDMLASARLHRANTGESRFKIETADIPDARVWLPPPAETQTPRNGTDDFFRTRSAQPSGRILQLGLRLQGRLAGDHDRPAGDA